MKALILKGLVDLSENQNPLVLEEIPIPVPKDNEVLIRVTTCGIYHNCIIDTTLGWKPVIKALENLRPNGRLVINAIRKEDDDKSLSGRICYVKHLWMEKEIRTVANVSKFDFQNFLSLAAKAEIKPEIQTYQFNEVNNALREIKNRQIKGAKILKII